MIGTGVLMQDACFSTPPHRCLNVKMIDSYRYGVSFCTNAEPHTTKAVGIDKIGAKVAVKPHTADGVKVTNQKNRILENG